MPDEEDQVVRHRSGSHDRIMRAMPRGHRGRLHRRPERHRDVRSGAARAAVFGMSDGLISNLSLVLGVAGGGVSAGTVRLAGLTGLLAGAVSMAVGEYVSMRAHADLLQRELDIERRELRADPTGEQLELALLYERRGVAPARAQLLARDMMRDPDLALEAHARE